MERKKREPARLYFSFLAIWENKLERAQRATHETTSCTAETERGDKDDSTTQRVPNRGQQSRHPDENFPHIPHPDRFSPGPLLSARRRMAVCSCIRSPSTWTGSCTRTIGSCTTWRSSRAKLVISYTCDQALLFFLVREWLERRLWEKDNLAGYSFRPTSWIPLQQFIPSALMNHESAVYWLVGWLNWLIDWLIDWLIAHSGSRMVHRDI